MIKAIIFDLDGLLIDSEPQWAQTDRVLLKELGVKNYHNELRMLMYGTGQRECAAIFIKHFRLKVGVEEFIRRRWEILYSLFSKNLGLMPGAKDLLIKLSQAGFKLALATGGHTKKKSEEILEKFSLKDFFEVIVSGLDVKHSKPAPDLFLLCAQELSVLPLECLVLEDAENGVVSAKAAGMKVIGVNPDSKIRQTLKESDLVVESLKKITPQLIRNL